MLLSIPALTDNYIWLFCRDQQQAVVVDPGEAEPVLRVLSQQQLNLHAILLTHHHGDHTAGVETLRRHYPNVLVIGPQETAAVQPTHLVQGGETVTLADADQQWQVIATPGHTLGHVCYYADGILFCGDTLFSIGCGRLFEGSAEQMYDSLQRLSQLPDSTLVCAAHEYTAANLRFACHLEPENPALNDYSQDVATLRHQHLPTLPSTLRREKALNPFLRCHAPSLRNVLQKSGKNPSESSIFAQLRALKDQF
ncbi:MAG: hydroxyacylglutathione hydrolase [Plesiomonas shigelloides]